MPVVASAMRWRFGIGCGLVSINCGVMDPTVMMASGICKNEHNEP